MIRPLRVRHRRWSLALALLLPIGLVAALAIRPAPPAVEPLPAALGSAPEPDVPGRPIAGWGDLWQGETLSTRVTLAPGGARRLDLVPHAPLAAPDLLVYWTPRTASATAVGAPLPPGSRLLGGFDGTDGALRLPLPAEATAGGRLILFSLAWGETIATAELPPLPGTPIAARAVSGESDRSGSTRRRSLSTRPAPAIPEPAP